MSKASLSTTALAITILLAAPAFAADPDPAQVSFDRGVADLEAGRFDKACPAIEESYKLDPRPGTLFTLAECEAKRGRLATAVKRYDEYLALHATLPPDKKQKQGDREQASRKARAALVALAPELTLTLAPGAPRGTAVTLDGAPMAEAALGVAMRVDPGDHVITTQAPGGPATEQRVTVGKKERKAVLLEAREGAAAAPIAGDHAAPAVMESPGPSGRRLAAFAVGGVGVVGVLIGAITGGLALGKKSTVSANCGIGGDPTACNSAGLSAASSLKTLGTVSTVGIVVGGAALATGIVLFATEPRAREGTAARGTWVSAEVISTGTTGGMAGLRGGW